MGKGFRLIVAGIVCVIISIGWTLDAASNGELSKIVEGSIWKGPLLGIGGVALVIMGIRMINAQRPAGGDE